MEKVKTIAARVLFVLLGLLWPLTSAGEAATVKLTCSAKETIGNALKKLKPGDTLLVSGTCNENVEILEETARVVLDGQGKATINGPDKGKPTVEVRGRGITIEGFTVTGGENGIVVRDGGQAVIDGNTVQGTARNGIVVQRTSFSRIVNNTIQNTRVGIVIAGASFGWVGFLADSHKTASPNIIQNNGQGGIFVGGSSAARVVGNTIRNNKQAGIVVTWVSQADISNNRIDGNDGNGIVVNHNSFVRLVSTPGTEIFQLPNSTESNNGGVGITCASNSSVDGRLGSLNGSKGAKDIDPSCADSLKP